jgi:hypothetical protein
LVQDNGAFPSVAIRDGTIHVAHSTSLGGAFDIDCGPGGVEMPVGYATVSEDSVSARAVAPEGGTVKLALAGDGSPRMVFSVVCGDEDLYADGSSGTFDIEPIPLSEDDSIGDMAIGPDGTVHVLFHRTVDSTRTVGYIALTDEDWSTPELISDGNLAALAVDGRGSAHVVFSSGDALMYAQRQDEHFLISLSPISQVGLNAVLALDIAVAPDGRPHVVYTADDPESGVFYLVGPAE